MKKFIRGWFWSFMGYGNGEPVNNADLNRIMSDWHRKVTEERQKASSELLGTMFEHFRQAEVRQEEAKKTEIIQVRIVK